MTEKKDEPVVVDEGDDPEMDDGVSCCLTCFTYF
jgi:hypothetical protein